MCQSERIIAKWDNHIITACNLTQMKKWVLAKVGHLLRTYSESLMWIMFVQRNTSLSFETEQDLIRLKVNLIGFVNEINNNSLLKIFCPVDKQKVGINELLILMQFCVCRSGCFYTLFTSSSTTTRQLYKSDVRQSHYCLTILHDLFCFKFVKK